MTQAVFKLGIQKFTPDTSYGYMNVGDFFYAFHNKKPPGALESSGEVLPQVGWGQ
jgi:hypothetical protein